MDDHDLRFEFARALNEGAKISAIKALRSLTGLGLKEAKDMVEGYYRGKEPAPPVYAPEYVVVTEHHARHATLWDAQDEAIRTAAQDCDAFICRVEKRARATVEITPVA